jgi:hypothetical protein
MGRSLAPAAEVARVEARDAAHHNPFDALGARFLVAFDPAKREVHHRQTRADDAGRPVYTIDLPAHYAVGSGSRGRSYLTDRSGYLFQTPISWFAQKQIWDLSPGFAPELLAGRPVPGECLYCHANHAHFREGSINRYDEPVFAGHAIGCERCHGPGTLHVQSGDPDDIVNPRRLTPALRDSVCEQCHLEGATRVQRRGRGLYDFRPGLPLEDFWSVFVHTAEPGEERKAVTHVEQMHESRCYQASTGDHKLGCVSCHDPHVKPAPAERVAYYRGRCLSCHQSSHQQADVSARRQADGDHGCSLPVAVRLKQRPDDSCADCHMPRYGTADIVHTASTDHRVVRRPQAPAGEAPGRRPLRPLVSFHRGRVEPGDGELARDLGVALVKMVLEGKAPPQPYSRPAVPLLDAALQRDPDDVPALEAKGLALRLLQRRPEALAAFERALAREPERDLCLMGAALCAHGMGWRPENLDYWRRSVAVNPYLPANRANLVQALFDAGAWDELGPQCQAWVRLDPASVGARQGWIACLLHEGKKDEARAEFAKLEALRPPQLAELRAWFEKQLK